MKVTITKHFQAFIKNIGIPLDEILQKVEIPNTLWKEELEFSPLEYYLFLDEIENYVTDEQILMLSDIKRMQRFLPPFFAALCSSNGLQALKRFGSYKRLLGPLLISVEEQGSEVSVKMSAVCEKQEIPRILLINEQLLMLSLVRTGTGCNITPVKIESPYKYGGILEKYIGITPNIRKENQILFRVADLKKLFVTQNNIMLEYLEPELKKRLELLTEDYSFIGRVQKLLFTAIPSGKYSLKDISKTLGVSPRTMQRNLSAEGTSFTKQVKKMKQMLAVNYLKNDDISIDEISVLVGYQNKVSFMRAFKQWTGMTVMQYKKQCSMVENVKSK